MKTWAILGPMTAVLLSGCATGLHGRDPTRSPEGRSQRIDVIEFKVRSREDLIFSGIARVNGPHAAHFFLQAGEAPTHCRDRRSERDSHEAEFQVNRYGGDVHDPDTYRLRFLIISTRLGVDCKQSTRTVTNVQEVVELRRGQRARFAKNGYSLIAVRRR